ncbi:hypothetical protein FO440_09615 [Mucilaginibacter corticis]|uniref:Uncharacterized protein n=1 Tax=Mucilaginibacter corticis TaxID=2597670 RepID=A0A556MX09_9SPHI|nr:hypothetical protein [Mucilaginibacter corticis]TSJ44415.1 hypothetical protein FO440_09615 [Mucilaginibacter corticis]
MVPFEIEIEWNDVPVSLWVEQLDYLADENGLMRFDVRGDARRAVISVNIESDPEHLDFTFEAMQAEDQAFSADELLAIIKAIRDQQQHQPTPQQQRLPLNP